MVVEREIREAEDDEALLRSLIRPEEDRRRHGTSLVGRYRWFRSANVIPMERYRERRATLLGRQAGSGPVRGSSLAAEACPPDRTRSNALKEIRARLEAGQRLLHQPTFPAVDLMEQRSGS